MWIITHDFLTPENEDDCAVGLSSCDFEDSKRESLQYQFRLLDDDGELYYEGLTDDANSENAFDPLDDFGLGYAGCTEIRYLRNGKWESL
ncbi:MAG: hypothetical protein JWM11_383 [Planctomycetaceae bacterium]|nr:hypothetical protein [Planctomycetaceae bacterium]